MARHPTTVSSHRVVPVVDGWTVAPSPPGTHADEAARAALEGLPARVPGTVASALAAAGRDLDARDLDAEDWTFLTTLPDVGAHHGGERIVLRLGGIATIAEVLVDGRPVHSSPSMFARHAIDLTDAVRLDGLPVALAIVCRSVAGALRERRPRPRYRTRVVAEQQLRYIRTSVLGRAPGFAPGPAPVGPYRDVTLELWRDVEVVRLALHASLAGADGVLAVDGVLRTLGSTRIAEARVHLDGPQGRCEAALGLRDVAEGVALEGCLRVPGAAPWLPHTHGDPALHAVHVELVLDDGRRIRVGDRSVGFRTVDAGVDRPGDDGLALSISGVPVFCRGALWTPVDPVALAAPSDRVRERLVQLRDAGLNMVRVPGTGVYEDDVFHAACDELGMLVWQDLMLANMDYPVDDPGFAALLGREVEVELERLGGHASTAVVCGGSEVEQQATMVGLPPSAARNAFIATTLPALAAHACPGVPVVPSSPCGGDLPFRTGQGIAHYFGVGAYLRPLADARAAAVRFASECLAFANVPEQATLDALARRVPGGITPTHPAWKRGVPRDTGAGWDFDDVRDHYLALLYDVEPVALRSTDPELYLELSRLVSGEVMAEVIGEWRRTGSPCAGALVLQAGDLVPGAGWGLIDAGGMPKPAYHVLRRACLPRAVWSTDEGLDGIDVHVANDAPEPLVRRVARRPHAPRRPHLGRGADAARARCARERDARRRGAARTVRGCRLRLPVRASRPRSGRRERARRWRRGARARPRAPARAAARAPRDDRPARSHGHAGCPARRGAPRHGPGGGARDRGASRGAWPRRRRCVVHASARLRAARPSPPRRRWRRAGRRASSPRHGCERRGSRPARRAPGGGRSRIVALAARALADRQRLDRRRDDALERRAERLEQQLLREQRPERVIRVVDAADAKVLALEAREAGTGEPLEEEHGAVAFAEEEVDLDRLCSEPVEPGDDVVVAGRGRARAGGDA